MSATRCLKLLLLLSLILLALRATSLLLLLGGHGAPAASSSRRSSWAWRGGGRTAAAATGVVVSAGGPVHVHGRLPYRQASHRRRPEGTLAASDSARRLRQADDGGGDWFEDDKRLAPTGSNPLHNLR